MKMMYRVLLIFILCLIVASPLAEVRVLASHNTIVFSIAGQSMEPTFHNQDQVVVDEDAYPADLPAYRDIVIVRDPRNIKNFLIKRVIGLPGDTLEITDGRLIRNQKVVEETYLAEKYMNEDMAPTTIPKGEVFVMGDNRNKSIDSRSTAIGFIPVSYLVGKVEKTVKK
jgi:signal peptidase I